MLNYLRIGIKVPIKNKKDKKKLLFIKKLYKKTHLVKNNKNGGIPPKILIKKKNINGNFFK